MGGRATRTCGKHRRHQQTTTNKNSKQLKDEARSLRDRTSHIRLLHRASYLLITLKSLAAWISHRQPEPVFTVTMKRIQYSSRISVKARFVAIAAVNLL